MKNLSQYRSRSSKNWLKTVLRMRRMLKSQYRSRSSKNWHKELMVVGNEICASQYRSRSSKNWQIENQPVREFEPVQSLYNRYRKRLTITKV